jgi:SAM-dependent methyltransferase
MDRLAYTLEDQALMSHARRYFAWQARLILPHLGKRVVEVGCGTGNFTQHLTGRELVLATDLEPACLERLVARFPTAITRVATPEEDTFLELAHWSPDSIVCLNVLEHIQNDAAALRRMAAILPPGGRLALLVPALPALYGPIDRNLGHFRRYTKRDVDRLAFAAALDIHSLRYMNAIGAIGWYANARLFRRAAQSATQIALFDNAIVPVASRVEALIPPPLGQSVLAILSKSK